MQIEGQVAIVTGGASGLGAAVARHLAERGADVAILDANGDLAREVAAEIGGFARACDVSDPDSAATKKLWLLEPALNRSSAMTWPLRPR